MRELVTPYFVLFVSIAVLAFISWLNHNLRTEENQERMSNRLRKQRKFGVIYLIIISFVCLIYANTGYQTSRGTYEFDKSCSNLWKFSQSYNFNRSYGPGNMSVTASQIRALENAFDHADLARSFDPKHYEFFAEWLTIYIDNLKGEAQGAEIHAPLTIWRYQIEPVCANFADSSF